MRAAKKAETEKEKAAEKERKTEQRAIAKAEKETAKAIEKERKAAAKKKSEE